MRGGGWDGINVDSDNVFICGHAERADQTVSSFGQWFVLLSVCGLGDNLLNGGWYICFLHSVCHLVDPDLFCPANIA